VAGVAKKNFQTIMLTTTARTKAPAQMPQVPKTTFELAHSVLRCSRPEMECVRQRQGSRGAIIPAGRSNPQINSLIIYLFFPLAIACDLPVASRTG